MNRKVLLLMFIVLVAATLAACASGGGAYFVTRTPPPPPAAGFGMIGSAPGPGFVWVNGYWEGRGGNWHWVRGSWVRPPRRGAVWVSPSYRPYRNGYQYRAGYWR